MDVADGESISSLPIPFNTAKSQRNILEVVVVAFSELP